MEIASPAVGIEPIALSQRSPDRHEVLRRVFHKTGEALYRFIVLRVGGDRETADELLQQTCHEAARHRKIPRDENDCEAWLRGIARNLVRRHWRRARRRGRTWSLEDASFSRQLVEDMETRPLPPDALAKEESVQQLLMAITSLPASDQQLVLAFYFDGRSQIDIAESLAVSVKSVETRLYRARNRLRAILRNMEKGT